MYIHIYIIYDMYIIYAMQSSVNVYQKPHSSKPQ